MCPPLDRRSDISNSKEERVSVQRLGYLGFEVTDVSAGSDPQ